MRGKENPKERFWKGKSNILYEMDLEDFGLEFDIDYKESDESLKDDILESTFLNRFLKKNANISLKFPPIIPSKKIIYTSFWQIFWKKWKERERLEEEKWEREVMKKSFLPRMFARFKHWVWKQIKELIIKYVTLFFKRTFKIDDFIFWKSWSAETANKRYSFFLKKSSWEEYFYYTRHVHVPPRFQQNTNLQKTLIWEFRDFFYGFFRLNKPYNYPYTPVFFIKRIWWESFGKNWVWSLYNFFKKPEIFYKNIFNKYNWIPYKYFIWSSKLDDFSFTFTIISFFYWTRNNLMNCFDWFIFFYLNELVDLMHI